MPHNFSLADCLGGSLAFVIFPLFALVPGYVAAWLTDLVGFRQRRLLGRLALAIPLSIGLSPVLGYEDYGRGRSPAGRTSTRIGLPLYG